MYLLSEEDRLKIPIVRIVKDFSSTLRYGIPKNSFEIPHSAKAFRDLFLKQFDKQEAWQNSEVDIILDFMKSHEFSDKIGHLPFVTDKKQNTIFSKFNSKIFKVYWNH